MQLPQEQPRQWEFTSLSQNDDSASPSAEVVADFQVAPAQVSRHGAGVDQRVPRRLSVEWGAEFLSTSWWCKKIN